MRVVRLPTHLATHSFQEPLKSKNAVSKFTDEPTTTQRCRSETENFILEDRFSSVLSHFKKISSLWKPEIRYFRHFPKLKIAYFIRKNPFNFS